MMFRFAFNTAFIPKDGVLDLFLNDLDPDSVRSNKLFPQNFMIQVKFLNQNCECTADTTFEEKCTFCMMDLQWERENWEKIYAIMKDYNALRDPKAFEESKVLLFNYPEYDDIEKTLSGPKKKMDEFEKVDKVDSSDSDNNSDREKKKSIKKEDLAYYLANDASAYMGEERRFKMEEEKFE